MASLKEIASELGVSQPLVSRVLSGKMGTTGVSAKMKKAILAKASELHYEPNHLAVALKNGRKGAIAVFMHCLGTPGSDLSTNFLNGLTYPIGSRDLRIWLRLFESDGEFLKLCNRKLTSAVDGLVVAGAEHPDLMSTLRDMDKKDLPIVSVFSSRPNCVSPTNIAVDYVAQCYLTTRHLIEQGCQRIAHFKLFNLRYEGYMQAHRDAGLPVWPRLTLPVDSFEIRSGAEATKRLIESGERFDGIVTESDSQAIGALRTLREAGYRVPEDVKVTGVDNSPLAEACEIPLTSVSSEMATCGKIALQTIVDKIEGQDVKPKVVQPQLHVRKSTGG